MSGGCHATKSQDQNRQPGNRTKYSYDELGRRIGIERDTSGADTGFGYDAVSRLDELTHDLSGTSYDSTATFSHSPSGQIATQTQSNPGAYSWAPDLSVTVGTTHNGLNQVTQIGSTPVDHDDLGNLETGESAFAYGYDLENRLRSATASGTTVSLTYDPLGVLNLLSKGEATGTTTTEFLYDGVDLIAEYDGSGALLRRYVHGPGMDEPLVWYEGSGTSDRRYLHADERGSIVAVSNNAGSGLESFKYTPHGESANADNSRFGYTGQIWLAQLGLYYYKARMYSPELGRFLQPDPIGYAGGMNLYAYVTGDPINNVDPFGLENVVLLCRTHPEFCRRGDPAAGSITERDIDALDAWEAARDAARKPAKPTPGGQEPNKKCVGKYVGVGAASIGAAGTVGGAGAGVYYTTQSVVARQALTHLAARGAVIIVMGVGEAATGGMVVGGVLGGPAGAIIGIVGGVLVYYAVSAMTDSPCGD